MIEMANFLKNELSFKTGTKLKTKFKPVSKWQRLQGAQTELIIYEDENANKTSDQEEMEEQNELDENDITVSQLAVLDSLLKNGLALSLKGRFINQLPELNSLKSTLIYVNLSYNNFYVSSALITLSFIFSIIAKMVFRNFQMNCSICFNWRPSRCGTTHSDICPIRCVICKCSRF